MKTFGECLRALRLRGGLTQAALAQQTGLSLGIVRDYEQQRKEPSLRYASKLASVLAVSLDEFIECFVDPSPDAKPAKVKPAKKPKRRRGE